MKLKFFYNVVYSVTAHELNLFFTYHSLCVVFNQKV